MYISNESQEEAEKRLQLVLTSSQFKVFEGAYYFKETSVENFKFEPNALAMVKDHKVWSYLVPSESNITENFKIFSFHFKDDLDNSGFVGWLGSNIKNKLGSGLFVICGQNSSNGGIFDYWGCPIEIAEDVLKYIDDLRKSV